MAGTENRLLPVHCRNYDLVLESGASTTTVTSFDRIHVDLFRRGIDLLEP